MALELRALIAKRPVLESVAAQLSGARVVDLASGLCLLPIPFELESGFQPQQRLPAVDGLRLSSRIESLAREASKAGQILYVEADYSPGRDFQGAILWQAGKMAGGPRIDRSAWDPREPAMTERPVNAALRAMGVQRDDYGDEWDAVALARHSRTEDW